MRLFLPFWRILFLDFQRQQKESNVEKNPPKQKKDRACNFGPFPARYMTESIFQFLLGAKRLRLAQPIGVNLHLPTVSAYCESVIFESQSSRRKA